MIAGSLSDTATGIHSNGYRPAFDRSISVQSPPLSAPTAINPAAQSSLLRNGDMTSTWTGTAGSKTNSARSQASSEIYRSSSFRRGPRSPMSAVMTKRPEVSTGLPDHRLPSLDLHKVPPTHVNLASVRPMVDHLRLQTPSSRAMTQPAPASVSIKTEPQVPNYIAASVPMPPSLPSFASFQEHANRGDDADIDGPEMAPMAARLTCHLCTELKPLVHDIAIAATELDDNVQSYFSRAVTRALDMPTDNPVRAAEWTIQRLRLAKQDMIDAANRSQRSKYYFPMPPAPKDTSSQPSSPWDTSRKRTAAWNGVKQDPAKRIRTRASSDEPPTSESRVSPPYVHRNAQSPLPQEAAPLSAYPSARSPGFNERLGPSLPSPTSSTSATTAHIADLQHQVTLKSLALQSLQSEYSALLEKLQREQSKSRAIEKKTTVSEHEVNELTGRNEELSEQVKALETQLEESEKRREADRAEATKEKEQWSRMLDMSGRLQAKLSAERQSLVDERDSLRRRAEAMNQRDGMSKSGPHGEEGQTFAADAVAIRAELAESKVREEGLLSALLESRRRNGELAQYVRYVADASTEIERLVGDALVKAQSRVELVPKSASPPTSSGQTRSGPDARWEVVNAEGTMVANTTPAPGVSNHPTSNADGSSSLAFSRSMHAVAAPAPTCTRSPSGRVPSTQTPSALADGRYATQTAAQAPPSAPGFRVMGGPTWDLKTGEEHLPGSTRSLAWAARADPASLGDSVTSGKADTPDGRLPSQHSSPGAARKSASPPESEYYYQRRASEANISPSTSSGRQPSSGQSWRELDGGQGFRPPAPSTSAALGNFRHWNLASNQGPPVAPDMLPPPKPHVESQAGQVTKG